MAIAVIGLAAWLARSPQGKVYTSPPFDHSAVRFQVTLPPGWEAASFKANDDVQQGWTRAVLYIGEADRDWRPKWLRKWFPNQVREYQPHPFMLIEIYRLTPARIPASVHPGDGQGSLAWKDIFAPRADGGRRIDRAGLNHWTYHMGRNYFTEDGAYQIYVQGYDEDPNPMNSTMDTIGSTIRLRRDKQ